jgi:DNA (cytosine-5)-methyltransferase 1
MKHLDLFSGIGGFALACQWAGIETIGFVEIDKYCQKVLRRHWPNVPIVEDIRDVKEDTFPRPVDLITGGFPCQDISNANTTTTPQGLEGERSGLWNEYKRLVSTIRPKYIVVENTSALLFRGLARVLGDLCEIGYDAEWKVISAQEVGAPHKRERVWVVAYPRGQLGVNRVIFSEDSPKVNVWDKDKEKWGINRNFSKMGTEVVSRLDTEWAEGNCNPDLLRISYGIPNQLDRLKCLGNAIVPQIAYEIIKVIMTGERYG